MNKEQLLKIYKQKHKNGKYTKNYKLIFEKFKIYNDKTYNPPEIDFLDIDWKFLSWLIGFVDGDGTIYEQNSIRIENHKSWKYVHDYIKFCIEKFGISSKSDINIKGNSFILASTELFYLLKNKIKELNLEVLDRKWNKAVGIKYNKLKLANEI